MTLYFPSYGAVYFSIIMYRERWKYNHQYNNRQYLEKQSGLTKTLYAYALAWVKMYHRVQFHDHWYYGYRVLFLQPEREEEELQ